MESFGTGSDSRNEGGMCMSVPMDYATYLLQVSIVVPSDGETIVEYSRSNPNPAPVSRDELDTALLQVFGEEVIGYEFEDGVLHVMVAEMPQQEDLETAIDQLFKQFTH